MWRKGKLCALLVGVQTGSATVENILSYLKKLKMDLPYHPAISLLGIYLKKPETLIRKSICTPMCTVALFTIAKIWKQPQCPAQV